MDTQQEADFLTSGAAALGVSLTSSQASLLQHVGDLLEAKNKELNLTRIARTEFATLHVLDSLAAAKGVDFADAKSVLDVGTGAGFPAFPLAIAYPHLNVIAFDARKKKLLWINEVAQTLGIKNLQIVHGRAEQCAESGELGKFDVVTSRALASYETLLEWQLPFVRRPQGKAVLLKSTAQREELGGMVPSGWKRTIHEIELPSFRDPSGADVSTAPDLRRLVVVME